MATLASVKKLLGIARQLNVKTMPRIATSAAAIYKLEVGHAIDRWADRPTGRLERSFKVKRGERTNTGATALVYTTSRYAMIHDRGGTIRPLRGRFLVFKPRGSRRRVFAKSVQIRRKNYLALAAQNAQPRINKAMGITITIDIEQAKRGA